MGTYTAKTRTVGRRPRSKRLRELGGSVSIIGGGTSESGGSYAPLIHSHEMEDVAGLEAAMAGFLQQLGEKASTSYVTGQIANISGALQAFQLIRNLVTAISSESTDDQYPSAKLLYDSLQALANVYAAKTDTYTKSEVDNLISTISTLSFQVVATLPVTDIRTDVIYLVPSATAAQANIYDEYIYINNDWECIGSTAIDLSGCEQTANKVTALTAQSTDVQYPSALAVWSIYSNLEARVARLESMQTRYQLIGTTSAATFVCLLNGQPASAVVQNGFFLLNYTDDIISMSFASNTTVQTISFDMSDRLALVTSIDGAFAGCSALTTITMTACDLSALTSAVGTFTGCVLLSELALPANSWAPDLDLSDTALEYDAMMTVVNSLAIFASGTHNVEFSATKWSALTIDKQEVIYLTAYGKGWQTNIPSPYYIEGHSSAISESFTVILLDELTNQEQQTTITCATDGSGKFRYEYRLKKIVNIDSAFRNNSTITDIIIFEKLDKLRTAQYTFAGATITDVQFPMATFSSLKNTTAMFSGCQSLSRVDWDETIIDFSALEVAGDVSAGMFRDCVALLSLKLNGQTFASLSNARGMFSGCNALSVDLSTLTLEKLVTANAMFAGVPFTNINLSSATFAAVQDISQMFYLCRTATTLDLSAASFAKLKAANNWLSNATNITTIIATTQNIGLPATATISAISFQWQQLTYQSILNVANWLADLTGATAKTITFNTTAWNALTAAEQSNIDAILQAKNWTRVLSN